MDWRTLALAGCTLVFWSSAFAVIRVGLRYWGPGELALARFVVASVTLALGLGLRYGMRRWARPAPVPAPPAAGTGRPPSTMYRGRRIARASGQEAQPPAPPTLPEGRPAPSPRPSPQGRRWGDVGRFLLLGATGIFLYHTGLNWGETRVSAATASLLVATAPALTALLSRLWLGERLSQRGWQGLMLSFLGVAIISWAATTHPLPSAAAAASGNPLPAAETPSGAPAVTLGSSGTAAGTERDTEAGARLPAWAGPAAVGLAALGTSVFFVLQRPLSGRYDALTLTAFYTWAGTLLLAAAFGRGLVRQVAAGGLDLVAWSAALYLGVFPSALAYWCWSAALARVPAARVASLLNLNPLLAVATAWIMLGERPSWAEWLGGAVAVAGVLLVQAAPRPRAIPRAGHGGPAPAR